MIREVSQKQIWLKIKSIHLDSDGVCKEKQGSNFKLYSGM